MRSPKPTNLQSGPISPEIIDIQLRDLGVILRAPTHGLTVH